ncbi:MAG: minichromosome maintenance protein MCM [Candidatus Aenigmatarchaeota archaeon]
MGVVVMDIVDRLENFLRENYDNDMLKATKEGNMSVVIDFNSLDRFSPVEADMLLESPAEVFASFSDAVKRLSDTVKYVRIKNLPERRGTRIRNLRSKHLNKLWCIDAIVKSASEVKPQISEIIYECPSCGTKLTVKQDMNLIQRPDVCECGRRGDFKQTEKQMIDIRWLGTVEPFEVTTGEQPGELSIFLKDDLTTPKMQKMTDPGNRLKFVGILKELPKRIKGKLTTTMDMYLETNHVEPSEIEFAELEITEKDKQKIYELAHDPEIFEKLKASIAPAIYGFDEIKECIALQLFGGISHIMPDGTRIRGNIHILITGDPGVGKSQILKLVSTVVPRGRYVSGKGVTGAGLTATVRKDDILGTWVLEAGALILCNKGIISIDEFDKMNIDDQIAMHEAMSLETVSIAKASIIATLPAQTAVLAGANPKTGRFDRIASVISQIEIPETLLSRFDLKFALLDEPDRSKDDMLAEHIITSRTKPELIEPVINVHLLRKYIAFARQINTLELTDEASKILKDFYVDMRNLYTGAEIQTVSITLRQYEALLRMAEASAKVRLKDRIEVEDAERAIRLMRYSLKQLGTDIETGRIDIDKIESGVTASARRKIEIIRNIVDEMQKSGDISYDDLLAEAQNRGIEENAAKDVIDRLKREGMLYEPKAGFLRKV